MTLNLLTLFTYYLLITISIIGYGILLNFIILNNCDENNIGKLGIQGIFFYIFYSYLSHIFVEHTLLHNFIFLIFGILIFFLNIFLFKILVLKKKEFFLIVFLFIIFFVGLLIHKNHDDFSYYHFPYAYYLTQNNLIFGIGQFNHGFRTPSSIFYFNSLTYLPLIKYHLFNLIFVLIVIFTNIILIKKILIDLKISNSKIYKFELVKILSLFAIIFVNIFFYRISEHGTDRSAQILVLLLIIELIDLIKYKNLDKNKISFLFIIAALVISIKAFFILYLIFVIPLIYLLLIKKNKVIEIFKLLILNKSFLLFISTMFFVLFSNFANTGCILYPLSFTCYENLSWAIPSQQVIQMNNWYELWSKGGAAPNFRVENPDIYIQNFNWIFNWVEIYFFNKVSDFLLGITTMVLVVLVYLRINIFNKKIPEKNNFILIIYFLIFLLSIEWFINHPALRYGGYCLIFLLFILPISAKIALERSEKKQFLKKVKILICISFFIFFLRNIDRISAEVRKYDYKPLKIPTYEVDKQHFRIDKKLKKIKANFNNCKFNLENCKKLNKKLIENYGFKIFVKDN